jgi:hypothetical protein
MRARVGKGAYVPSRSGSQDEGEGGTAQRPVQVPVAPI